ncbi:IS3 family transposase [Nakamurella sp. YIM 132087]|uniref:IS3 family transposase n=1 Tax=Nakamurella alba TaxID=2665158 RepID=A0A7K1FKJ5_9ACTN|nr:IS3 family transposase [Nakamurella alba]
MHVHAIPDLAERRFDQGGLNMVGTSDITYLDTDEGWLYLCVVRDGHSRRVIGYAFSDSLHTDMVETALRRTVTFRDPDCSGVIFHADRGCQYTSAQLAVVAGGLGVRQSVGRTGVCWDNAQRESFWSTLNTEFYRRHRFTTRAAATRAVTHWIEDVYNRRRRHSAADSSMPASRGRVGGMVAPCLTPGAGRLQETDARARRIAGESPESDPAISVGLMWRTRANRRKGAGQ